MDDSCHEVRSPGWNMRIFGVLPSRQLILNSALVFLFILLIQIGWGQATGTQPAQRLSPEPHTDHATRTKDKPVLVLQAGHTGGVSAIAISPDGRLVATGGGDRTIKLWLVSTGEELHTLSGDVASIDSLVFSPDGKLLAAGDGSGVVTVWDVQSGRLLQRFPVHKGFVDAVAFSPDGSRLASASWDGMAKVVEAATGKVLTTVEARAPVTFSPDGRLLATGAAENFAEAWDLGTGKELGRVSVPGSRAIAVVFDPDSRTVHTAFWDGTILWWNASSGQVLQKLESAFFPVGVPGGSSEHCCAAFNVDGKWLATIGGNNDLSTWKLAGGTLQRASTKRIPGLRELALTPDGELTATVAEDFYNHDPYQKLHIQVWKTDTGDEVQAVRGHAQTILAMSASPNGRWIASVLYNGTMKLWDGAGRVLRTYLRPGTSMMGGPIVFSANSKRLAVLRCGSAEFWNLGGREPLKELVYQDDVTGFSQDLRLLATVGADGITSIREASTGKSLYSVPRKTELTGMLPISPDGRFLAFSDQEGAIELVDGAKWQSIGTLPGSVGASNPVFSPDGKQLITTRVTGEIQVWDLGTKNKTFDLVGHHGRAEDSSSKVYSVAFSPNGKRLASAGGDSTVRLWNLETGKEEHTLRGHTGWVGSVAFLEDGRLLASAGGDGSTRLWEVATGKELLRLVPVDTEDWAAVSPDGLFDASPGGMQLMHWMVGDEPIALSQLKDRYYEPGLLAKILGFNQEPLHDVSVFQNVKLFPLATAKAPSPQDTKLVINLNNRGGGIGRVQVFVNGKELIADARGPKLNPSADHATLTINLAGAPIRPGEANNVRVVAWNQEGYLSSRGVELTWKPEGKRDLTPPDLYAIVAGISKYSSSSLNLSFASKDATDMARAIQLGAQRLLLSANHVHLTLLTSPADQGDLPTKENIRKAFEAARKAKPGDILIVYLAGHGVAVHDNYAYPAEDARTLDLSDPEVRARVSITSDELAEWMKQIPALKQVMIIDTCAAGAAAVKLVAKRDIPGDQVRAIERLKDRTGVYVLMGSAADAASYEASQYGQGLLTYALLKGMKGAALRDGEYVDVARLFHEVEDDVPELARDIGGIQQPRVASPDGASFDIGRLLAEDRQQIPLATVKPLLLRPQFQNSHLLRDNLGLGAVLRSLLREETYAASRGGTTFPAVFVDDDEFPGAVRPTGGYTVEGTTVKVRLVLARDDNELAQLTAEGITEDLNGLAANLATKIAQTLAGLAGKP